MEPARGIEPRPSPHQGDMLAIVTRQASLRELESDQRAHDPKSCRDTVNPPRIVEPSLSADLSKPPLQGAAGHRPGGHPCARRDLEPATSRLSTWPLCQLEYEHMEPPPGADPGHPPYESGAAAVRGGVASGAGLEPAWAGFRVLLGSRQPARKCTGGGTCTRMPRGLSSRGLHCRHSRVRRQGLEPRFSGLRVQCFTRIARGAWSRTGESNPDDLLGGQTSSPLDQYGIVVPAGTAPASAAFQATANLSQLENREVGMERIELP
jgi:hypothetical protein